jgi:hypothetical protein
MQTYDLTQIAMTSSLGSRKTSAQDRSDQQRHDGASNRHHKQGTPGEIPELRREIVVPAERMKG